MEKTLYRKVLFISVCCILFSFSAVSSHAADTGEPPKQVEAPSAPPPETGPPAKATSSLWGSFIWEAIPADWLRDSEQNVIMAAYQQNDWKPFFIDSAFEPVEAARSLLKRLENLESEAIDPKPFKLEQLLQEIGKLEALRVSVKSGDSRLKDTDAETAPSKSGEATSAASAGGENAGPSQEAAASPDKAGEREQAFGNLFRACSALDIKLAETLARYAGEMDPFSREDQIRVLAGQISMDEFFKAIEPTSPHYKPLLSAMSKYRQLAARTPQQRLDFKSAPRPGSSGPEVANLQKRLQQEEFYEGSITGVFDSNLEHAVKQFQSSHRIDPDGVLGQRTKEWLNVSYNHKAEMIAESVRLLRQSQTRRNERYVRINIPQFMLEYVKDGKPQASHRVIVGKASGKKVKLKGKWVGENQTPPLASNIEQVIINPRWYVSDRIRMEMDGLTGGDPTYFSRHGYVQMNSTYPGGSPRLFQPPGPKNPLGRVKFEFPNAYAVYLHDTPMKGLFQRSRRDFSHGCIRVEKADQLARQLLSDDQNPEADKTTSYFSKYQSVFIRLAKPVPIIIEYMPVSANESGRIIFFGDPYGWLPQSASPKT